MGTSIYFSYVSFLNTKWSLIYVQAENWEVFPLTFTFHFHSAADIFCCSSLGKYLVWFGVAQRSLSIASDTWEHLHHIH